MSSSRTDLFKTSTKRGRACCNPIACRQADGMDAYQIRSKAADGANLKKFRGDSVVRSSSGALKGQILSLDGSFVGSTYGANEAQQRKSRRS